MLLLPDRLRALSVCFTAALAVAQDATDAEIAAALQRARPALLAAVAAMTTDGSVGQLGLVCLAALHDGVAADDAVLAAALQRLADLPAYQTYDLALRLLVAEACPTFPGRVARAKADAAQLLRHRTSGAFQYMPGSGQWDLSNTQYAALGLRAAASLGVELPRSVWIELADEVSGSQRGDGGFAYTKHGTEATPSMTVAGIAVLAICRQATATSGRKLPEIDRRLQRAWKWMERHVRAIGELAQAYSFYFHYGLERAAILEDVTEVAATDWYHRGARMFVDAQRSDGGWSTPHGMVMVRGKPTESSPVDTAFAVLFLRRKFQKIAGPITPERTIVLAALSQQSTVSDVDNCVAGLVRRGKAALPDVLLALRGEVVPRRRAAVAALRRIAGEDFGIDAEQDAAHNAAALRRAELWHLKNR